MRLLEPLSIGLRTAPNRVMFGPHETNLGWGRTLSERHVAYYRERAKGGCGTIVVEAASVHATDWPYERCPDATDSEAITRGWGEIVAACRPHGALVIGALSHAGGQGSSGYSQRELWAPSDEPEVNTRETPKEMEFDDIGDVIAGFALAARAAVVADLDGVEINAGQHSLLRQFFSGLTNRRNDVYGLHEAPLRLTEEVLAAVRQELGPERVLGLRLSCDEMAPWAGVTPERGVQIAAQLASMVDYIVVVRGSIFSVAQTRPDGHVEPGFNLGLAAAVAQAAWEREPSLAVFAQGSIVDPNQAEAAIEAQHVDGVEMTRAQIADPEMIAKLRAGTPRQVRPCVLCNQWCMVRDNRNPIVSCIANPRAGHETIDPDPGAPAPDDAKPNVLVVGGGPAGMEAARVAASRGARVRMLESTSEMGGMIKTASKAPGRGRLALLSAWLESECRRLGVAIGAGHAATPDLIARFSGQLIIATGSRSRPPEYDVDSTAIVLDAAEAMAGSISLPPGPIAVWDPVGSYTGLAVAEYVLTSGREVVFITPDHVVGTQLSLTGDLAPANVRLQQAGVQIVRRSRLIRVAQRHVEVEQVFTADRSAIGAVALIDAGHRLPNDHLWNRIGGDGERIGDVVAPRTIGEAIREGQAVAMAITMNHHVASEVH